MYSTSFLNWTRRMIQVRKAHKAFSRGDIEFLDGSNSKALNYLRVYGDEVLLIANNLSRYVQPVELDLKKYDGFIPVELIGGTHFPAIGQLPYFLTLGPHAFYWFQLKKKT